MQYVFSMTSRMVTIALGCALLLCVLLFLLGFEIGARFVGPASSPVLAAQPGTRAAPPPAAAPATLAAPESPAPASDSSTY
ncbi:MAG TPA: hypothetical protein VGM85_04645 [Paraburkholderia sp.]|jgi:hypothetical protein